jgi:UDP-N-acetylglucosamine 4,6-dehydratase
MLTNSSILITGGTGSFGHAFVPMTLAKYQPARLVIYSRDEMKQWEMAQKFQHDSRVQFIIGDVRDQARLTRALDGIDYVVHAAATKIVPTAEYNPFECIKTNINGAMNLVDACMSLIRSRGHFPKGGYDVQSGIKQGRPASPAAVL